MSKSRAYARQCFSMHNLLHAYGVSGSNGWSSWLLPSDIGFNLPDSAYSYPAHIQSSPDVYQPVIDSSLSGSQGLGGLKKQLINQVSRCCRALSFSSLDLVSRQVTGDKPRFWRILLDSIPEFRSRRAEAQRKFSKDNCPWERPANSPTLLKIYSRFRAVQVNSVSAGSYCWTYSSRVSNQLESNYFPVLYDRFLILAWFLQ